MTEADQKEILFLIARFLNGSTCKKSAKILAEELAEQKLLPTRTDWQGQIHFSGFEEVSCKISESNLDDVLSRAIELAHRQGVFQFPNMSSLLGNCYMRDRGTRSLLTSAEACAKYSAIGNERQGNLHFLLSQREVQKARGSARTLQYSSMKLLRSSLGHLAPLYCMTYDATGQCIVTGADDGLVKIWCSRNGRLLATLRGHHAEVSDIAISQDNTLIASASNDKSIRIWCAQTGAPLAILTGHTGIVSSVQFIPSAHSESQYIASTGMDGFAMFWKFDASSHEFSSVPLKFMEKNRMGDQTLCSAYSPGGSFYVTGCSDHIIRVYDTAVDPPQLEVELKGHTDLIMVMQCGRTGRICFATGARDGTGRLWEYRRGEWHSTILPACHLGEVYLKGDNLNSKWKRQVTMVAFDCTDTYVFTASSPDCVVRSWHIDTGALFREYQIEVVVCWSLQQHSNEVFVIETHPRDPRVFISAGHDGFIVIWDMFTGDQLNLFTLKCDEGTACLYDARFSPDGTWFTTVDSMGCLSYFGLGKGYHYKKYPAEQFFHTDYRPLLRDRTHNVIDEQAQIPPHLMPPPVLVDIDGNTHTMAKQIGILELICRPGTLRTLYGLAMSTESQEVTPSSQPRTQGSSSSSSAVEPSAEVQPQSEATMEENRTNDSSTPGPSGSVADDTLSEPAGGATARESPVPEEDSPVLGELPVIPVSILWTNHFTEKAYEDAVWLWQNRSMVPMLDGDELRRRTLMLDALFRREVNEFAKQRATIPLPVEEDEMPSPVSVSQPTMLRSGRVLLSDEEPEIEEGMGRSANEDQASVWSMVLSDEDAESLLYGDNSSTDSSAMSDWGAENPAVFTLAVRKSSRKRSSRHIAKDPDADEGSADNAGGESSIPQNYDRYQPSSWLTEVESKSTPYYPQVGDAVMYFRQGHEQYLQEVRKEQVFSTRGMQLPWQHFDLRANELCQVTRIQFVVGPPTLCEITLGLITAQHADESHPKSITFRYHDMDDVLDFIIPAETFCCAVKEDFNPGVRFRSFIEDSWWSGTVLRREPFSQQFPNSYWLCYRVQWDDGVIESMSPWDMTVEATESGSPLSPCTPSINENDPWDGESAEAAKERILAGIEQLCAEVKEAELFAEAVNLTEYPDYCAVVPLPMDLSLIQKRLQNGFYRRKLALLWDALLIYHNAIAYNEDGSDIVEDAKKVVHALYSFIRDPESSNILDYCDDAVIVVPGLPEKEADVLCNSFILKEQGSPGYGPCVIENQSVAELRQGKKRMPATASQDFGHYSSWSERAKELLEDLVCKDFAEVFLQPVDVTEYQDYPYLIQRPVSLSEVSHKLDAQEYGSPKDFTDDLVLIVKNSEVYNTDIRSLVYHLTLQLKEWLAENLVQFWGDLSSLEYPTRSKVRKVAAEVYSHDSDSDLTNNVHVPSTADSEATCSTARLSEEDNQPVSYRLRKRQVSENRHTEGMYSLQGSSEEQTQRIVLTRHGRKVKPTQRFSPLVK